ncbi:isoquinoline 1-oxidoreductase, beta subunit [Methylobacillus rhizosphaerae]|uniref:Isoquinoline 1-oxidoreductase, beta subunit n=1 Tax=Methylobacillus rhizosphaerae TaxID=551994 RepID=A0A238ZBQ9_9PROT|nr:molybdopterin cofactor-binding domain-containing protein [Methylobacillus rhizosphaerae]SNR80787.1 isoquinoline 1-oxidoreductase, beta subunit [Methylobacillus rhizosphaerae]
MSQELMMDLPDINRRRLLKGVGIATGLALTIGINDLVRAAVAEPAKKYGGDAMPGGLKEDVLVFVSIGSDGIVNIVAHRSEMGQGVRTSLPLVIADEMEADWARVRVVQAEANEAKYGNQNTDGSRSMRHHFEPMRRIGATARMMLETAAAAKWGVPRNEVRARNHQVVHQPSGKTLGYGELAVAAAKFPVPVRDNLKLKSAAEFRYIGKQNTRNVDGQKIVTGTTHYGIDTQLKGMLHAVIARPPVLGGKVKSFDASAALKVPGVLKVLELKSSSLLPPLFHPLGGIAVLASNTWAAIKGREALKIVWDHGANAVYDSQTYRKILEAAARKPAKVVRNHGDAAGVLARDGKKFVAEYYQPHIAHGTMEPPAATAQIVNGKCEAWACVQDPQAALDAVAAHLGFKPVNVRVNVTLLGGGFGRKSKPDYVVEAALLSQAMKGKPVKVTWTREDDLHHDYFHTVSLEHMECALDAKGMPTAWLHRTTAPTIASTFVANAKGGAPFELGMGAVNIPFNIPHMRVESPEVQAHTRIGWFRSVSNIPHAFAVQSFVAELAHNAKRDHRDYLLELLGPARKVNPDSIEDGWNYGESPQRYPLDVGRMRHVVELVTSKAGWGRKLPKGHGLGLAFCYSFVTYIAAVVEVVVGEDGEISIPRVDIAVDCGPQVNPDRIRSQAEGACIMGASLTLTGEISFKNGAAQQSNFHEYQVLRIDEAPREIHVHMVEHALDVPLGGVGEPVTPTIAPAICNAIFAATGKRIRTLPIRDQLKA